MLEWEGLSPAVASVKKAKRKADIFIWHCVVSPAPTVWDLGAASGLYEADTSQPRLLTA